MVNDIYHVQILKEFDCIFEDERSKIIREKWAELIPKVFEVAKNDQNASLQELYVDIPQCTSKGTMIANCMCHKDHMSTESKSILASMILVYLLADTHTTATTSRIVIFVDVRNHHDLVVNVKTNFLNVMYQQ